MRIVADTRPIPEITERLLTSAEVATVFRVDPKTIARWARDGLIEAIRTPGGRLLRYRESAILAALQVPAANEQLDHAGAVA